MLIRLILFLIVVAIVGWALFTWVIPALFWVAKTILGVAILIIAFIVVYLLFFGDDDVD